MNIQWEGFMRGLLIAAICCCYLFDIASAGTPPPAEAFGRIPAIDNVVISPGGTHLAWGDNSGADQVVVIYDSERGAEKRRARIPGTYRLRALHWMDDQTLLVDVSFTHSGGPGSRNQYEWSRTLALDAKGGDMRMLLMDSARSLVTGSDLLALHTERMASADSLAAFDAIRASLHFVSALK